MCRKPGAYMDAPGLPSPQVMMVIKQACSRTFGFRRSSYLPSQGFDFAWRFAADSAARAMCMSKVRRYTSPRLLMPSSVALPPLECCRGTSPSHAASCRPFLKLCASAIEATSAVAVSGPTPGIFSRR